ncbi:O-antigen ligase family protein [Marinobacter sediminum]|uniref:O-antigen ligase family protein n=1 Tax=Marinobacter sediminum TaxID=256323 RepID=UPI001939B771
MLKRKTGIADQDFFALKPGVLWRYFKTESFAFWMICAYLFLEYFRPQSIYPSIDVLPWTKLVVCGAILGCFTDKSVRWVSSSINFLLILFLVLIILSSFLAYFPRVSFENLSKYYLWVIIYFLIINIVNTKRRFYIFIGIFLLASFKLSLSLSITWARRGFSFADWGLMGPPGFFQNSGELAIQMLVYWPIALAFAQSIRKNISEKMYLLCLLMPITGIMVILGASSRGAQLALVIQLMIMNYKYIFKLRVAASLLIFLSAFWFFLPDAQKERFETIGHDGTSKQRILYFENGVKMINDNPVLGVGYFNFAPYYEKYFRDDVILGRAELPHNIFIQVGTDTGLLGLFTFILIIVTAFRIGNRFSTPSCQNGNNVMGRCANLSLIGFLVAGQFVTVTYYPFLWIHLALIVSMENSFKEVKVKKLFRAARA